MAKHMRGIGLSKGWKIAIAATAAVMVVALLCALFAYGGVLDAMASLFGSNAVTTPSTTTTTPTTTTEPEKIVPVYQKPEQMKGVYLTPGVDYYTSSKNTVKAVKQQIDAAFSAIEEWEFNTLLLPLKTDDKDLCIYPSKVADSVEFTEEDGQAFDPISYILSLAREKKLYVYGVLDLRVQDGEEWDPRTEEGRKHTLDLVREVTARYAVDGYFVSGFSFAGEQVKDEERETAKAALDTLIKQVTQIVYEANPNYYTGLLSNGIWAHSSVDERGSKTAEYYEEFTDGCADTLSWLEKGLFNCVMVRINGSTSHPTASFQKVLEWWDGVAEKLQLPLYISHSASRLGTYHTGWKAIDQLAQQYLYCKSTASWQGSCYDSLNALHTNTTGAADALKRAYEGTLDEEYLYKQLKIAFPTKTNYTTNESSITIHGSGDTNFPLTVNGEEVELTENGLFSLNYTLKIGVNTFKFMHKGSTKTYSITYKQTVLQSVSPEKDMTVDGGNPFIISAIARKGSTVTATINGKTIKLDAYAIKEEESGNASTDFQEYKGTYTLPAGKIGQAVDLGKVTVKATYNGMSETQTGGKVTVKALPVPTTTNPNVSVPVGTPIPAPSNEVKIVTITSDYAETFSGGGLTDDYSRPYNSYLPKATKDYLAGTVYHGNFSYYLLASGKRVYCKDAAVTDGGTLTYTPLQNGKTTVTSTHTNMTFDAAYAIPVYARTRGQKYYRESTTATPHYGLEPYSQTTTHIEITFYYLSEVPSVPDISKSPLFSSAEWVAGESKNCLVLKLTLKKKGAFYGVSTSWNGNQLTISFLNPANVSGNAASEKLKGIRILLDPGHGSDTDKSWEAPLNLAYANTLKAKLEALGATVDMTRTGPLGKVDIPLQNRVIMAQTKGYHLVISVHMNASGSEMGKGTATGATVHYYSEWSYTPSKFVYDKMHAVETTYGVGTSANGTPRSSGTVWGTLYMTRSIFHCPSILLECAFMDNPKDLKVLDDPVYRDKLMQAVTDGVVEYFSAM
ncbi:MAG: N-acetylmuramoyl-L-alanine amidase [Clostridia bacterium]|nr:N-acetylmuramoyl-L-alanine amidase [Clostridia bacterium]